MRNNKVQKMVSVAMLAAIGVVLQYVAFPIIPSLGFLKIDFSDIPVMISMFLFGPLAGISTAFIRSVLHLFTTGASPQNLVGDAASFFATTVFTLPMYYFFKRGSDKRSNKILGVSTGIIALTVFMGVANYFVITPIYLQLFGVSAGQFLGMSLAKYVTIGIIPFNLIKGAIVSAVFLVLHAKLLPWLSRKQYQLSDKKTLTK
ncbi:ECF transporter S component [Enterococcus plantarum]|uniref:Riboflavin transporter n=1 Tax=Enterococcus plantarum TaxID=1077675 RepID=A0A2W3Z0H8_9ENTE|nr:ECF transporter S component [Enterococcus plantarum]MBO0423024.1 ECF transporter S component [Enterococcus plantarum]PZL73401.1 ECF transporter S component [Enterococcus plantarum]